jgi:mannose-6-phosphate isomerase-like protein (cupin superfamily)
MLRAGFTWENPLTHSRFILVETEVETQNMGWLLEAHCVPNVMADITEHIHLSWTETFTIISGEAHFKLDGVQRTAATGEAFVVEPGQLHVHPWNAGNMELVYRQSSRFAHPSPHAVQDVLN